MARIVVRCQYTGHYIFTGLESRHDAVIVGGRIYCPYCAADHVWTCGEAQFDDVIRPTRKPLVRQAS